MSSLNGDMMTEKKLAIVLATGAFDILHYGHVRFFEEAKKAGGKNSRLIVIVASDRTVEARKGRKPVLPEWERRALVASLRVVDESFIGFEDIEMEKIIERLRPDIIAVGYDQNDIEKRVRQLIATKGYTVKLVKLERYGSEDLDSSSKIMGRILESWKKRP